MVTGGNKLGDLTVGIRAPLGSFKQDLVQAEGAATQTGGKIGGAFGRAQSKIQGAARQVPIFGDQLAMLATPTGAATVAIGGLVTGLVASVKHVVDLERELRPMIQRSGLAAESLQVLTATAERLGSEDGLEGVTDSVQELQLRLAEATQDASGPAVAAFEKLGLSSEALIAKSPEQMFLDVITALQEFDNAADRKFLADELMGGSSEKLSGIINANATEFAALRLEIEQTHDVISTDALAAAKELDDNMAELTQTLDSAKTTIGNFVIPVLNDFADAAREDIGELQTMKETAIDSFGAMSGAAVGWQVEMEPVREIIPEIGNDFEDLATSALEASNSAFNKDTPGSFPHTYFEGVTHVVQANQQLQTEMSRHQNTLAMMQVQANRDQLARAEELAARRLAIRQQGNEDVEEETEEHHEALVKFTDDFWKQQLQREEEAYQARFAAQLAAYDEREENALSHFEQLELDTGIHLSNLQAMYAASGVAINASMSQMMDGLTRQVDHFIAQNARAQQSLPKMFQSAGALNPFSGANPAQGVDASEATWQVMTPDGWVDQDSLTREELDALFATGARTRRVHDTLGVVSSIGDTGTVYSQDVVNQWRYYLDRLAAAPITAGSPYALTRADLGLAPVGSTPPTLPGLPGFADGGIAMRPMAANIAESGPEAIIPLQKVGGTTINVIVGEGAYVVDDFVEAVQDALHEANRRMVR